LRQQQASYPRNGQPTTRIIIGRKWAAHRDQRAVCCASRAAVALGPFDDARSLRKSTRSSRVGTRRIAVIAACFRLRIGRRPFRFGCVSLGAALRLSLHFPRSPTADRSCGVNAKVDFINEPVLV
jgi:hypothetical protein